MHNPEILDSLFREAVSAIDAGDVTTLQRLLVTHPRLVRDRLDSPGAWLRDKVGNALEGFFRQPYLLWFVVEDSVALRASVLVMKIFTSIFKSNQDVAVTSMVFKRQAGMGRI